MYKNIIDYYMMANNLKNVVRIGWKEVGIPKERIESVADHIYGTMVLALGIIEEKKLDLDVAKLFKMILVKEFSKAYTNREQSAISGANAEKVKEYTEIVLGHLANSSDLLSIFDEYESRANEEAKFVYKVSKLESDLQAKIYEKSGDFTVENAREDIKNYPEDIKNSITEIKHASDGWLAFDRTYYEDDEFFMNFSKEIEEME